jgi:hypothetical protein
LPREADLTPPAEISNGREDPMPTTIPTVEALSTHIADWGFRPLAAVALLIGVALVFFPGHTADYFAWTIKAPIAAATLGVWFLSLSGFAWALSRGPVSAMRAASPAIAVGSALMLVTTILHRAAFNWGSPAAWAWLLLYIAAPPGFLASTFLLRGPDRPPETAPRPSALLRGAALTTAGCAGTMGTILFLWPTVLIPSWPWPLLPLGARTYAAFAVGHALWAWLVARGQVGRSGSLWYLAVFPLAAFIAPWLQPAGFRPSSPGGVAFLLVTGGLAALTACALRAEGQRAGQHA